MDTRVEHASLFEADEHEWLLQQAAALAAGRLGDVDAVNLSEYLESMGRSEQRKVRSRMTVLLQHLLKARFQPEMATRSWSATVIVQHGELSNILDDSATLRRKAVEQFPLAYALARRAAAAETGLPLSSFPEVSPWTLDQSLATGNA